MLLATAHLRAATPLPCQYRDGLIWVKISVSGKGEPLHFLLDSGAGSTVIDLSTARHLGLRLGRGESVQGCNGRSAAYRVEDFSGELGGVPLSRAILAVDLSGPGRCCHQRIDGLIGADFLRNHVVQIDYASQTLRLLSREEAGALRGETLPLTLRNDSLCARASVAGNSPELLRLDTGCSTALEWVITGDKAKRLGGPTIGLHSGPAHDLYTDVQLGKLHLPSVKTGIHSSQMFAGEAGLIGNGVLSRFVVTLDAAQRRCILASR